MLSRPKLGVSSWIFGDLPLQDIAARLQALQFDGVALPGDLEGPPPAAVRDIVAAHDLELFAITPQNVDLAHPQPELHRPALDYYLALLEFAAAAGAPLVQVQPALGRVRPVQSAAAELELLGTAVDTLAARAAALEIRLAVCALNRYETFLLNNGAAALAFTQQRRAANVGIMLSAFHMNIEEQDAAGVIRAAGERLFLYAMADSNRQAIGRGHIKLGDHLWGLEDIGYSGPILFECLPPGPDPFNPRKDEHSLTWVDTYLRESRSWF